MSEEMEEGSLDEPTEDPELVPEDERVSQGVRMTPALDVETLEEFVPNEAVPDGVEVVGFDFLEAFLSLTGDLYQHPQTTNVERDIERAVPEIALRIIEDGLGGTFSADIKSFYRLLSAISFRWYATGSGEEQVLGGAFDVVAFARTFGLWVGELWPEDPPAEGASFGALSEYETRWRLRGFDMPEQRAGDVNAPLWGMLAFDEEDLERYDIYTYHPETKEFLRMEVSLIDYLYCVLGACGAPGWQLLFTSYDFEENPWDMPAPQTWISRVEQFFPAFDTAFFTQRLVHEGEGEEQ